MKHLMLKAIACAIFILPASQLEANDYGGFKPGQTFTRKVTKVTSVKISLTGGQVKAPIPKSVPKLKKGQKVKFKIGKKGQLALPKKYKMAFDFIATDGTRNDYASYLKKADNGQRAVVYKNGKGKPTALLLSFFRQSGSGLNTIRQNVSYDLK